MTFSSPAALWLLPIVLAGCIWFWSRGAVRRASPRRITALALRVVMFVLLVLAAAGASIDRPRNSEAVSFVADLSASTQAGQPAIVRVINEALRSRGQDDQAALVAMGQSASIERPPSALSTVQHFESVVDPDFTNLEAGLSLGGALLPSSFRRRVVLLSDGRQNEGDAVGEAQVLRQQGIRVDVIPVVLRAGPEVRVDSLSAPQNVPLGDKFTVQAQVTSSVATSTEYDIFEDSRLVRHGTADLSVGLSTISSEFGTSDSGRHTFQIILRPALDTRSQNNQASAFVDVRGRPHVLVVEGTAGAAANVDASLRQSGILSQTIEVNALTPDLAVLQGFDAVVLVDVSADALGSPTMRSLKTYVSDLGHGLVTIGGLNSYGLGNYGSSPLEDALPITMDLPKRKDLPRAAVVLIIEDLESQSGVDISKRAGEAVVGLLNPSDMVAVSDAGANLVWPLRNVSDKSAVIHAIDVMQPQDPASYVPFLSQAYNTLRTAKVQTKQIILLGDGDAAQDTAAVLKKITAAGIQVSTIETNASVASDFQNMRDIAAHGGGKYYPADNINSIPQIFLKVARTVSHDGVMEGRFIPLQDAASPILNDVKPDVPLSGYVITTPKALATVVLSSNKSDPILAQWQYGLGRSVAWMSDSQGRWTTAWLAAAGTRNIWSAMVQWVLPPPQSTDIAISPVVTNGQIDIGLDALDSSRYTSISAHIVGPDVNTSIALEPDATNHFDGSIAAGTSGAYYVTVEARLTAVAGEAPATRSATAGVVVPYAADYRDSGVDLAALRAIAQAGGGAVLTSASAAFADNLPAASAPTPLQTPLLLLALLLFPIDVGVRRLVLSRSDVMTILKSLRVKRRERAMVPPSAPLTLIRSRRTAARRPSGIGITELSRPEPARTPDRSPPRPRHERKIIVPNDPSGDGSEDTGAESNHSEVDQSDSVASRLLEAKRRRAKS
jgi:uncharacterized membrane protein